MGVEVEDVMIPEHRLITVLKIVCPVKSLEYLSQFLPKNVGVFNDIWDI